MRITVRLQGGPDDPKGYHPGLPTFQGVEVDYENGTYTVDVPDEDAPLVAPGHKVLNIPNKQTGVVDVRASDVDHNAWHTALDARYAERKGEFRPEVI